MIPSNRQSVRNFYDVSQQLTDLGKDVSKFHLEAGEIIRKIQALPLFAEESMGRKETSCEEPQTHVNTPPPKKTHGKPVKSAEPVPEMRQQSVSPRSSSPPILWVEVALWKVPEGRALVEKIGRVVNTFDAIGLLRQGGDFSRLQGIVSTDCSHLEDVARRERERVAPLEEGLVQSFRANLGLGSYNSDLYSQQLLASLGSQHPESVRSADAVGSGSDTDC